MAGPVKLPLSAVLITRDAERHLDRVLTALAGCAEILVLDSGSTDQTLAIARAHGARVEHQDWLGFGRQKRRAVGLARHDWILSIDADEVLDDAACRALAAIDFTATDPRRAWRITRLNHVGDVPVRHGSWNPDRPLRLFNRTVNNFDDREIHELVTPQGPVALLPGRLLHFSYRDFADIFRPDYHRLKARRFVAAGYRPWGITLALRTSLAFLCSYLLRLGFLDGRTGVVVALSVALNAMLGRAMAAEGQVRTDAP
jgi:glycosyltransferase involved in cell wall biosynthesis